MFISSKTNSTKWYVTEAAAGINIKTTTKLLKFSWNCKQFTQAPNNNILTKATFLYKFQCQCNFSVMSIKRQNAKLQSEHNAFTRIENQKSINHKIWRTIFFCRIKNTISVPKNMDRIYPHTFSVIGIERTYRVIPDSADSSIKRVFMLKLWDIVKNFPPINFAETLPGVWEHSHGPYGKFLAKVV